MKYTVLTALENGKRHLPGDVVSIEDKNEAARLVSLGVVSPLSPVNNDVDQDAIIEELTQIEAINKDIAIGLIAGGYDSIAKIQKAKVDDIMALKIKNVGKATAEKIIVDANENFEVEE